MTFGSVVNNLHHYFADTIKDFSILSVEAEEYAVVSNWNIHQVINGGFMSFLDKNFYDPEYQNCEYI